MKFTTIKKQRNNNLFDTVTNIDIKLYGKYQTEQILEEAVLKNYHYGFNLKLLSETAQVSTKKIKEILTNHNCYHFNK